MRLVALYIKEHEFIFDEPVTINFGGQYNYSFKSIGEKVYVQREENKNFIKGFFDQTKLATRIELISAIVGKNGTGKSSVLDCIRSIFIKNSYGLPYSQALSIVEIEGSEKPVVLHSDFESVEYRFNIQEVEKTGDYNKLSIELERLNKADFQTIYYSPHFDYKYNLNFDEVDVYDISFDKVLEKDLEDLGNKDSNANGWDYSPSQELIFKNSIRQLFFLSSNLVSKNKIFKDLFDLPDHGEAKLVFRGHRKTEPWNTPSEFRWILEIIKEKLEQELNSWRKIRTFDNQHNVTNQIDVNKYFVKRYTLRDFISVLERQMEKKNSFLSEGKVILENFKDETDALDAYNSFLVFIKKSRIKLHGSEWNAFNYDSIELFFRTLFEYIDDIKREDFVQNDNIQIEPHKVLHIIHLHRNLLLKLFTYYPKIKQSNKEEALFDNANRIEGFVNYIPTTKRLSSGENALLNLFSRVYDFINNNLIEESKFLGNKKHYILLLDEADLSFHPEWKRKFIKSLVSTLPYFFNYLSKPPSLQIVFTTHDPLTLSDIPQSNVIYLDKNEKGITIINHDKVQSFGANVHDLLAHSFFLDNGFMGEFAQDKITDLINYLTYDATLKTSIENVQPIRKWSKENAKKLIDIIDEPLIKERVQSLYNKKILYNDKELLRLKIQQLNKQLNKLEDEEN